MGIVVAYYRVSNRSGSPNRHNEFIGWGRHRPWRFLIVDTGPVVETAISARDRFVGMDHVGFQSGETCLVLQRQVRATKPGCRAANERRMIHRQDSMGSPVSALILCVGGASGLSSSRFRHGWHDNRLP